MSIVCNSFLTIIIIILMINIVIYCEFVEKLHVLVARHKTCLLLNKG